MKYKEYIKTIKELEKKNISMLELEIANSMQYYIVDSLTDDDKDMILDFVLSAYLKADDISIDRLVSQAIDDVKDLKNMSLWDLIEKCCY